MSFRDLRKLKRPKDQAITFQFVENRSTIHSIGRPPLCCDAHFYTCSGSVAHNFKLIKMEDVIAAKRSLPIGERTFFTCFTHIRCSSNPSFDELKIVCNTAWHACYFYPI